jgi:hypothetical protein
VTRIAAYLAGIAVIAGLLCLPALWWDSGQEAEPVAEPTRITSYRATFTVARDGDLTATEDIDVEVTTSDRHGIFRFFDRHDPNAPHARRTPTDIRIARDGRPEPWTRESRDQRRFTVVRIGDADRTLEPGVHHYSISYRIPGVLLPSTGEPDVEDSARTSVFYWNLIPGGWQQTIDDADLTVDLPAASVGPVRCTVGWSAGTPCQVDGAGTDRLTLHLDHVGPRMPVTVKAAVGVSTPPEGGHLPWTARWDSVLGTSRLALAAVLLLGVAGAVAGGQLGAKARERRPAYPLTYAPPPGIGPAQALYVLEERVPRQAFVGSLLHAAERGAVRLDRTDGAWVVSETPEGSDGLDPVTRNAYRPLTGSVGVFTARRRSVSAGQELKSAIDGFTASVRAWGLESGHLSRTGVGGFGGALVVVGLVLVVVCLVLQPFGMSILGIIPGAFAVCGISMIRTGAGTRRTARGRELWAQVGGFKRVLETPSSKHRFDFSGRQELYTAYIPWAVAFGCAQQWAQKYRTEVGTEPPVPAYFGGYAGAHTTDHVASMVSDFDSTVSSALSSYSASQSSSSGGGGGFSGGGGGGGGGGGSW